MNTERLKSTLWRQAHDRPAILACEEMADENVPPERLARAATFDYRSKPSDIVNEVMSFGSPTPVEVVISGTKVDDNRAFAEKKRHELAMCRRGDLQISQTLDYPTVAVTIDRIRAGRAGVTAEEISRALLASTSSSRYVVPNFWRDPASGIGYQVQVEVPQKMMASVEDVKRLPVKKGDNGVILLQDVADVKPGVMPGQFDRYNMKRIVSMTANIEGEALGAVTSRIEQAVKAAGQPPPGVQVDIRGQAAPMRELFRNLRIGLLFSVAAIFLLLVAYFQSLRLSLVAVSAVPAVIWVVPRCG